MRFAPLALVAIILAAILTTGMAFAVVAYPVPISGPQGQVFDLGFKALADQIPAIVGLPLEPERHAANGDSVQQTTKGLMAWRKADNWTAFTDGSTTWINGSSGVQSRANDERFSWEAASPPGDVSAEDDGTLWDRRGTPIAYIARDDENTIYLVTGEPVAYLNEEIIFGFNGKQLGWFLDGIVWDWEGVAVGFTSRSTAVAHKPEPARTPRLPRPAKLPAEVAPPLPPLTLGVYTTLLEGTLRRGQLP